MRFSNPAGIERALVSGLASKATCPITTLGCGKRLAEPETGTSSTHYGSLRYRADDPRSKLTTACQRACRRPTLLTAGQ